MFKKVKKCMVLLLIFALSATSFCFADTESNNFEGITNMGDEAMPYYIAIKKVTPMLAFGGQLAHVEVSVSTEASSADKVVMTVKLNKIVGTGDNNVKTWSNQSCTVNKQGLASFSDQCFVLSKGSYQVTVTGTVYKNNRVIDSFSSHSPVVMCN